METFDLVVVGNWHLSTVTAAVFASHGFKTLMLNHEGDSRPWMSFPPIPVSEPGLEALQNKARAQNLLHFSNSFDEWKSRFVWVAVDTPVDENDDVDLKPLHQLLERIKNLKNLPEILFFSSQLPLGFCERAEEFLGIPVIYVPENLRLGKGIETFECADRTVLGATQAEVAQRAQKELFKSFKTEFLICNLPTSEMVKHATNAFLATSISFANQMALIGEAYGVDNLQVGKALKMDLRIGKSAYVIPGLGFAGGTLPRDLRILQSLAEKKKLNSHFVDAVLEINEETTAQVIRESKKHLEESPGAVLILGYTYKADTDTLRRSLSIDVAAKLSSDGIKVYGFDPVMRNKDISAISPFLEDVENLSQPSRVSLVLLMTPRAQFKELSFLQIEKTGKAYCLDLHNFLNAENVLSAGFDYKRLWGKIEHKH